MRQRIWETKHQGLEKRPRKRQKRCAHLPDLIKLQNSQKQIPLMRMIPEAEALVEDLAADLDPEEVWEMQWILETLHRVIPLLTNWAVNSRA